MLKRLGIMVLVCVLVAVSAMQMIPAAASGPAGPLASASMPCDHDQPATPHDSHPAGCLDMSGCLACPVLTGSPVITVETFAWSAASYSPSANALVGRSVEPELFPPILRV